MKLIGLLFMSLQLTSTLSSPVPADTQGHETTSGDATGAGDFSFAEALTKALTSSSGFSSMFGTASTALTKQAAADSYARSLSKTYGLDKTQADLLVNSFKTAVSSVGTYGHASEYGRVIAEAFTDKMKSFGANVSSENMPEVAAASAAAALDLILPNKESASAPENQKGSNPMELSSALLAASPFAAMFQAPDVPPENYASEIGQSYGLDSNKTKTLSNIFSIFAQQMSENSTFSQKQKAMTSAFAEGWKDLVQEGSSENMMPQFAEKYAAAMPFASSLIGSLSRASQANNEDAERIEQISSAIISGAKTLPNVLTSPYTMAAAQIAANNFAESMSTKYNLNEYQETILSDSLSSALSAVGVGASAVKYADAMSSAFEKAMESNGIDISQETVADAAATLALNTVEAARGNGGARSFMEMLTALGSGFLTK